ncbi:menaquinol-cytochrome c reductase cytochrome b/c subunit [Paenibacillus sp. FJAT-26967]|uniref:menaquinol-cytochrome c reductase cytochrome b/c subunit n=1 Tax=Paenibacillus sp. FJAT-26967 TaxID=1729690 RepID=UPI000838EB8C|nr:menaquinol-cytochrome c reductase cytochrome b/c subunit [Paenibacillus sp. FJAT-26967]
MAHDQKNGKVEKVVYVGDSRVRKTVKNNVPPDYSAYPGKSEAFIPNFLLKEWMVAVVFLVGVLCLVISEPAPLGYPADPKNTAFIPMPDWYFLFMYQLLKYPYTSENYVILGTLVIPGLMFGGLLLAPFLDTGKERRFYRRPIASSLALLTLIACVYLTVTSWHHYQEELKASGTIPEHIKREEEMKEKKAAGQPAGGGTSAPKAAGIVAADDPAAEIYKKATCISCHGGDLKGVPSSGFPALRGVGDKHDKNQIMDIIKNGQGKMAAQYNDNIAKGLTDDDMNKLADWLAKQKKAE